MTQLKTNYIKACNAYLKEFCKKYSFDYNSNCWIGNQVGGVVQIADYFFSMKDIIYCINENLNWGDISNWYDYNIEAGTYGFSGLKLSSWIKNSPRKSKKEITEIKLMHEKIENLKQELKNLTDGNKII